MQYRSVSASALLITLLTSCVASQPRNVADVCDIFSDRRAWYKAAKASAERWGVPTPVNMAFIYQESTFRARAKPERSRILWIIPGPRPSSAYGYAQALDSTWSDYVQASGNGRARRNNFDDAIDFVAWYNSMSTRLSNIAPNDARNLYLAYHEGRTGFARKSYLSKDWLVQVAGDVGERATMYRNQLVACGKA